METPKVSIIMGIYNCVDTLERAIDSILKQTYKNWELIMCDDGSTDRTYDLAQKYAKKYDNIIVIQNSKNQRLAYSLNHCLQYATGKYIARMDADDESMEERLAIQVKFLEEHPEYDVVGTAIQIKAGEEMMYVRTYPEFPMKQEVWSTVPHAHPTILIKKSVLDQLGGYRPCKETMRAEDLDLWFRFKMGGYNSYNIQEPLYLYQESSDDYKKRNIKAALQTSKIILKYYREMHISKKYWYLIIKPVIAASLPVSFMEKYHKTHAKI